MIHTISSIVTCHISISKNAYHFTVMISWQGKAFSITRSSKWIHRSPLDSLLSQQGQHAELLCIFSLKSLIGDAMALTRRHCNVRIALTIFKGWCGSMYIIPNTENTKDNTSVWYIGMYVAMRLVWNWHLPILLASRFIPLSPLEFGPLKKFSSIWRWKTEKQKVYNIFVHALTIWWLETT